MDYGALASENNSLLFSMYSVSMDKTKTEKEQLNKIK